MAGDDRVVVQAEPLRAFAAALFEKVGVPPADAALVADTLVEADLRGVHSHGIVRLDPYIPRLQAGGMRAVTEVTIIRELPATMLVDGNNGIGQVISARAMELAIERARSAGIGVVGVRNSNHFGAAAYYPMLAVKADMVGLLFSNASPGLAPWGSITAMLGNNPWAIAVPAGREFPVLLDMANSVVARGKIRLAAMAGRPIPEGWAANKRGEPTTDAQEGLEGMILPVGGYKGSGISIMWDLLAGALTGAAILDELSGPYKLDRPQGTGHLFMAINVEAFRPLDELKARVDEYARKVHDAERAAGVDRIYLPGELEWLTKQERERSGIPLAKATIEEIRSLAEKLGVPFDR
ncbi:MAG: Ldh family oxidoreductase [Chloroflexi bacterium]|nr:Ldh family oxidoreductase [Chloroflexota bacterium]